MNPVSNYTIYWSKGNSTLQDIKVKNTVKEEQVQTTYFISEVTKDQLGNYTVQAINQVNQVTFNLNVELRGEKYDSIYCDNHIEYRKNHLSVLKY